MDNQNVNLFVYGSLRDPQILKSVCGYSFTLKPDSAGANILFAELALLHGYRRVSPDNVYHYAVPTPETRIEGFVIHDLSAEAISEIDRYEGKLYDRETVTVNTAFGSIQAQAYLASPRSMKKRFGDRFHVNLIHELWLRKRIEAFFNTHTRPGETSPDADIERKARRELIGTTERDLTISHLGQTAVSDFYLEHELNRPCPSIKRIYSQSQALPFIENYTALVVKQSLLNEFENIIQSRYRYELERICTSRRFYYRAVSLLIALKMINENTQSVDMILRRCLETMPADPKHDLIDYVKYAINAADSVFDSRVAGSELDKVRSNLQPGLVPIGAELELSNLGFKAVHKSDPNNTDPVFDGFRYFQDFCLDVLTWRLGGYIDDHSGSVRYRQQGFFELAPGRLNIAGEVSKPATSDPWIMNQLIQEISRFYPVKPHSLHLSFQMRRTQVGKQRILPLSFVKCLLAMGGGPQKKNTGRLWISRFDHDEIKQYKFGEELVFARTSKRKSYLVEDGIGEKPPSCAVTYVQQYKFIRLEQRANYEPLIMALKGLQLACNPADYLTAAQLSESKTLRMQYEHLKEWAANPDEISPSTLSRFLGHIRKGLMTEVHTRPAHRLHYIEWALNAIDVQLRMFNKQLQPKPVEESSG